MTRQPSLKPTDYLRVKSLFLITASLALLAGCGSGGNVPTPVIPTPQVNTYFALNSEPSNRAGGGQASAYTLNINRYADEFDQDDPTPFPINRGSFTSSNGFLNVSLNTYNGVVAQSPEVGNWILEKPGIMGFAYISAPEVSGLTRVSGGAQGQNDTSQNVIPFISNAMCPVSTNKQTYEYLTVPGGNGTQWNYLKDVAYGSADITTDKAGAVVNFTNLQQFLLPAGATAAGTAVTANPGPVSISGACGNTPVGSLISISNSAPEPGSVDTRPALASVSLSSGFLLEYNTSLSQGPGIAGISNVLGGGYGAVGLLEPSSAVGASDVVADSYQGFLYEVGGYTSTSAFSGGAGNTAACSSLETALAASPNHPSPNTVYGGEYPGNDPSTNQTSNCDVAIDLGSQDAKINGLFTGATIYIGPSFPLNNPQSSNNAASGQLYSFPAVVIAGQINGKSAIFVIGQDKLTNRAVGIYLLTSSP